MNSNIRIYLQLIQQVQRSKMLGRKTTKKSGQVVVGMAPELRLPKYDIPKDLRKVLEYNKKPFPEMTVKHEKYLRALEDVMKKKELTAETYVVHLKLLLHMEEYERELEMKMYDLNDQKIKKAGGREFCIHVPGLAEERPSLQLYDEVQVRQTDGKEFCHSPICYIGQRFVKIIGSDKFSKKYREDQLYNIRFLLPRRTIQCCQHALALVETNKLVPALFPEVKTCYNKLSKELSWFDNNIASNAEQKQAVANIVARTAHPAPYILFGPPGTGKTATLVEAISQIWRTSPSSHILICTPSNAAADEILKRLLKNIPQQDIHRMYGPSRNWDDVDEQIKPCSNFIDGEIIFLPRELIMLRRIVVVTLMTCARLLPLKLRENHFSYIFIDEAGQATEPETLIPLGLMSSSDPSHKGRLQGQLVIAGDPKQLGPSISAQCVNTLGISMLERLMSQCGPYLKDETGRYNQTYITKLIRNFRSHQSILSIPNKLFYDNELLACGSDSDINRAVKYSHLPNGFFPLIFHGVAGQERREPSSPSMYNEDEIAEIVRYLKIMIGADMGGRRLEQKDIGIVTPYKLQRLKIHKVLEDNNWSEVSVGTVEIFQGQERDVIIMSTVRSTICKYKGREHLGFLSNPKRFNVAVTRAKSLLITVGNPNILQSDDCWKALRDYCIENKAYIGTKVSQNLSRRQKVALIAKKYVPKPVSTKDFEFPEEEIPAITRFENCKLFENIVPRRRARMPKITKVPACVPPFESDSGLTSTSNSSSSTNSEPQDRVSYLSSNSSPSLDEDSDDSSLSTVDGYNSAEIMSLANDLAGTDYLDEPSSDCADSLDSETPTSLSDNDDDDEPDEAESLSTELKKVHLSQVNHNKNNSVDD